MVFFLSALVLFIRLHRFGIPTGADGFFYLKQIESLSSGAGFYYKDYSFAFAFPAALNFFLRNSLLSFEISVSLVFGGLAWITDRLVTKDWEDKRSLWLFRFGSIAFCFYSLMYLELTLVFLKTATGLFFLLLACERAKEKRIWQAAPALLLAVLCHKLMFIFAFVLATAWLIEQSGRSLRKLALLGVPLSLAGLFALMFLHPRLYHHAVSAYEKLSFAKFTSGSLGHDLSLTIYGGLLLLASAGLALRAKTTRSWPLGLLAFACLLPTIFPDPLNSNSITYRLLLVSAPFFIAAIGVFARGPQGYRAFGAALMLAALALNIHFNRPLKTWQNPWPRMIPETAALESILPPDALLYAPHGAEFYLAYKTPLRPRSFIIRENPDAKTFRLAYVKPYLRKGSLLKNDLEQMTLLKVSENFWLFKESDWLALLQLHLFLPHAMNTLELKPDFIANY